MTGRKSYLFWSVVLGAALAVLAVSDKAQAWYDYQAGCGGPQNNGSYYTVSCFASTKNMSGGGNIDDTSSMTVPVPGDVAPGQINVVSYSARDTGYYYGPGFSLFVGWCGSGNTCTKNETIPVAASSSFGISLRRIGPGGYARADITFYMNKTGGSVSTGCSATPNPLQIQNGQAATTLSGYSSDPWGGLITQWAWDYGDGTTGQAPNQSLKLAQTKADQDQISPTQMGLTQLLGIESAQAGGIYIPPPLPPPSLSFWADPAALYSGQSTTLIWSAAPNSGGWLNLTSNFYPGTMPASGSYPVTPGMGTTYTITASETNWTFASGSTTQSITPMVYPAPNTHIYRSPGTYTVRVTAYSSSGNSGVGSCSVTVLPPPAPTVNLKVIGPAGGNSTDGPLTVPYQSRVTLSWTSTDSTSCTASGDWVGARGTSGAEQTTALATGSHTYSITCTNGTLSSSPDSVIVIVEPPPAPTVDLKVRTQIGSTSDGPLTVDFNYTVYLSWTTTNATSCLAAAGNTGWPGAKSLQESSGVTSGNLSATAIFTLTCTGLGGSKSDQVIVQVNPPPADFPRALFEGSFAAPRIDLNRQGELKIHFDANIQQNPPPGFTNIIPPTNLEGT